MGFEFAAVVSFRVYDRRVIRAVGGSGFVSVPGEMRDADWLSRCRDALVACDSLKFWRDGMETPAGTKDVVVLISLSQL